MAEDLPEPEKLESEPVKPELSREERLQRLWEGRERAAKLRAEGLLPPRKNAAGSKNPGEDDSFKPGEQAQVAITDSAEFQAAVAAQVKAQIEAMVPAIAAMVPQRQAGDGSSTDETLSKLAMLIAELTDQGSSAPKRIPPEILLARKQAHDRMIKLIVREQRAAERDPQHEPPTYHLTSKIVARIDDAGEQLIEPLWRGADNRTYPVELGWLGIPNLAMEPQNASAAAIMAAFRESIGNTGATSFKILDQHPEPGEGIETEFGVTQGGRLVTGSGVQQRKTDLGLVDKVSVAMLTGGQQQHGGNGVILNKGASLRQHHGMTAPYKDIRVLGSIAPPARQNG